MDLMFLNKMTDTDMVQVLNFVINSDERITNVFVDNSICEQSSSDNQCRCYKAWNIDGNVRFSVGNFNVTDFNIEHWSGFDKKLSKQAEYIKRFRQIMCAKFGEEYANALYNYHITMAEKEREELISNNKTLQLKKIK